MGSPLVIAWDDERPDPAALAAAARALRDGRLVALPTETVYGLGANALDERAVQRLFEVKGRPPDNPLIVHLASADRLGEVVAQVTPLAGELARRWWPGPLTLVLEAAATVPGITTAGLSTVAVRVPDHPLALRLLAEAGVPVAAPSANRSGRPSPTTAAHVLADLDGLVDVVVDGGPCRVGVESTVVDARGPAPVVLREGAVTREHLGLGGDGQAPPGAERSSPGTRHRHYAPSCAVLLAPPGEAARMATARARGGGRVGLVAREDPPAGVDGLARFRDADDLARRLYGALRAAERAGVDAVVVEAVPEVGIGRAVMDRLRRAQDATAHRAREAHSGRPR